MLAVREEHMDNIILVDSKNEILKLLETFSSSLHSLSSGQVNKEIMAEKLEKYAVVLKMEDDGQDIAFSAFYCNNMIQKIGFLTFIAISPKYKRQGYGKKMLNEVILHCKENGMEKLALEVRKENLGAIEFYKRFGFRIVSEKDLCYGMELNLS
jgi:ribosomal protein S18 acetylase RimI-like enzyme